MTNGPNVLEIPIVSTHDHCYKILKKNNSLYIPRIARILQECTSFHLMLQSEWSLTNIRTIVMQREVQEVIDFSQVMWWSKGFKHSISIIFTIKTTLPPGKVNLTTNVVGCYLATSLGCQTLLVYIFFSMHKTILCSHIPLDIYTDRTICFLMITVRIAYAFCFSVY